MAISKNCGNDKDLFNSNFETSVPENLNSEKEIWSLISDTLAGMKLWGLKTLKKQKFGSTRPKNEACKSGPPHPRRFFFSQGFGFSFAKL